MARPRSSHSFSNGWPDCSTRPWMWRTWASVAKAPGNRLLMVTLWRTVCRARPATNPINPERAPLDRPSSACGALTLRETILTMRPKPRCVMPSTTRRIMSMGPSIIASNALIQSSRLQSRKSPGKGPSALLIRMSGAGQAASAASRPSARVRSAATQPTPMPASRVICAAACSSVCAVRAASVTLTPSSASWRAQARPIPRLPPNTSAVLPAIPRSMPTPDEIFF
ncbi:Uncharacterised protein [Bordetella pertussis]|nr:Uncharacterised protein [Bordetella pertussis]